MTTEFFFSQWPFHIHSDIYEDPDVSDITFNPFINFEDMFDEQTKLLINQLNSRSNTLDNCSYQDADKFNSNFNVNYNSKFPSNY